MDNPLSIVPSEGTTTEFPVLKAFQEYIDAEQAKARKRMLGLSVFFIVLLVTVVVTFVMILTTVLNRNQSLSDRLLDYALDERKKVSVQQPIVPVVQPNQPSADVMKIFMERMEREQAEMKAAFEKEKKDSAAKAAEAERLRAQEMARLKDDLAKARAKANEEAKKKAEIENHRRRLYPDYYRMQDHQQLPIPPPASTYKPQQRIEPAVPTQSSTQAPEPVKKTPPPAKKAETPLSTLKPVTYFNVDDEDDVPFLLETPRQNK